MRTEEAALADLLDVGRVDWVPLHDLIWYCASGEIAPESKELALRVMRRLFVEGLMVPGDLGDTGFEDWSGSADMWVDRAHAQLESFDWAPMGDGLWLRLTDRGRGYMEPCS